MGNLGASKITLEGRKERGGSLSPAGNPFPPPLPSPHFTLGRGTQQKKSEKKQSRREMEDTHSSSSWPCTGLA